MSDDPYFSFKPVVQWITGIFIALLTVSLPISAILSSRVKSTHDNLSVIRAGEPESDIIKKRQIYAA